MIFTLERVQMEEGQHGALIVKEAEVKPIQQKQLPNESQEAPQLRLTLAEHRKQVILRELNSFKEASIPNQ